jgi:hypothetical protein
MATLLDFAQYHIENVYNREEQLRHGTTVRQVPPDANGEDLHHHMDFDHRAVKIVEEQEGVVQREVQDGALQPETQEGGLRVQSVSTPTVRAPTETPTPTGNTPTPTVNTPDVPFDFDPAEYLEAPIKKIRLENNRI